MLKPIAMKTAEQTTERIGEFSRQFQFADDGRPITLARNCISFVYPRQEAMDEIVIGIRNTRPIIVRGEYEDIVAWWSSPRPKRNGHEL